MDPNVHLHVVVIAFKKLRGFHTEANITAVVLWILKDWNIKQHVHEITTDNASFNDKMYSDIQKLNLGIECTHTEIQCMVHIINLAAQKFLTNLKPEATEHEAVIADKLNPESQQTILSRPSDVLKIFHHIFSTIWVSNLPWGAIFLHRQTTKIEFLHSIFDMDVCCNSSFNMIGRILYLCPEITKSLASEEKLHARQLSSADWTALE